MLVLTWNLFHGRSVPDAPREQLADFAAALAGWEWDVALLQEVPPWWPPALGRACGASVRMARTSRNALLPVRRAAARRRPDLVKSNGGGANAILVRGRPILEHRAATLRRSPERRVLHAVRLDVLWVPTAPPQVRPHPLTRADLDRAGIVARRWAAGAPLLLGGDLNVPDPVVAGFADLGGHGVDRVLARGATATGPARTLEPGGLSDHAPVVVDVAV